MKLLNVGNATNEIIALNKHPPNSHITVNR